MEQQIGSKLEKEYSRLYIVTCLFTLYTEYIMWNARLDQTQAGRLLGEISVTSDMHADDTTLRAESEEQPLDENERVK